MQDQTSGKQAPLPRNHITNVERNEAADEPGMHAFSITDDMGRTAVYSWPVESEGTADGATVLRLMAGRLPAGKLQDPYNLLSGICSLCCAIVDLCAQNGIWSHRNETMDATLKGMFSRALRLFDEARDMDPSSSDPIEASKRREKIKKGIDIVDVAIGYLKMDVAAADLMRRGVEGGHQTGNIILKDALDMLMGELWTKKLEAAVVGKMFEVNLFV